MDLHLIGLIQGILYREFYYTLSSNLRPLINIQIISFNASDSAITHINTCYKEKESKTFLLKNKINLNVIENVGLNCHIEVHTFLSK